MLNVKLNISVSTSRAEAAIVRVQQLMNREGLINWKIIEQLREGIFPYSWDSIGLDHEAINIGI